MKTKIPMKLPLLAVTLCGLSSIVRAQHTLPAQNVHPVPGETPAPTPVSTPTSKAGAVNGAGQDGPLLTREQVIREYKYILKEVSELRGLSLKRPVITDVFDPAKRHAKLVSVSQQIGLPEVVKASGLAMRQLDLIAPNEDPLKVLIESRSKGLAGYYSADRNTLAVAQNQGFLSLRGILAHELAHALQHQNFDLIKMRQAAKKLNGDATQAYWALAEGDARWVERKFLDANPWRGLGQNLSELGTMIRNEALAAGSPPPGAPGSSAKDQTPTGESPTPVIPRFNYWAEYQSFRYKAGLQFVNHIRDNYEPGSIDRVFRYLPPVTTEQILHPEKYDKQENGSTLVVPDITPCLKPGYKKRDTDVSGEHGLYLLLANTDPLEVRQRAAAGWGGDNTDIYSDGKNGVVVVLSTVWDSVFDAGEWHVAYTRRANARFKKRPVTRNGMQIWTDGKKGLWMKRAGDFVFILEGTVGAFSPERVLKYCGLHG